MHPFRVVRRLLSRAREDWQDAVEGLFAPAPRRLVGPRPLRVMRLERRRVLSADFTLSASGLLLSGFDDAGGDTLTVQQEGDAYQFNSANGWEQHEPGQLPEGVTIDGDTLSVDRGLLEGLEGGLTIQGSLGSGGPGKGLDVRLGDADFSGLSGPVTLVGATAVGGSSGGPAQPFALFTAPTGGLNLVVAPSGTVLSSINVSGNLNVLSLGGSITDAPGSEIIINGNATLTSRATSPAGDFNGDGRVNDADRTGHWSAYYGMTSGASRYDGDANGDGRVDAADYTLWRDSVGQTGRGGIELANEAGDRFIVRGVATFDAAEAEGVHDIFIGVGGHAEFGSINAYGANVVIHEDTTLGDSGPTTVLGNVEAYTLQIESEGKIEAGAGSVILVEGEATLTSLYAEPGGAADLRSGVLIDGRFEAGGLVTLAARGTGVDFVSPGDIEVSDAATAHFGSLSASGAVVTIYEDGGTFKLQRDGSQAGTLINGIAAQQLLVHSAGPITDAFGSAVRVRGDASFVVSEAAMIADGDLVQAIVLADGGAANTLEIDGVATFIVEWPTTAVAGFGGPKGIDVGVVPAGPSSSARFNAGSLRFHAPGGTVRIAEGGEEMTLAGWELGSERTESVAHTLRLWSYSIVDNADAVVRVTGVAADGSLRFDSTASATFYASRQITLADAGSANQISIDGLASFTRSPVISDYTPIFDVGVLSTGVAADAIFNAGSLNFNSGARLIRIAEDSDTLLVGYSAAGTLEIASAGSITDAPDAVLQVRFTTSPLTGNATFIARSEIVLADSGIDSLRLLIDGTATFVSTDGAAINVGVNSDGAPIRYAFQAGSLRFHSDGGDVRIAEFGGVTLADWATGTISASIPLLTPSASVAGNLELRSGGIYDVAHSAVAVSGNATFVGSNITLADEGPTNTLTVGGVATFASQGNDTLRVGMSSTNTPAAAVFHAGSVRFYAPNGTVRIAEDDSTHLADWMTVPPSPLIITSPNATLPMASEARTIDLYSAGSITDAENAAIFATGRNTISGVRFYAPNASATFGAAESITLADGGADNKLMVDGIATFVSTAASGQRIDVGVASAGGRADAEFIAGGVRFWAPDGEVRLAEDAAINFKGATYAETPGTVIGSFTGSVNSPLIPSTVVSNQTGSLEVVSSGPITDAANAVIEVTGDASFRVVGPSVATDGNYAIRLADGEATNQLVIDGLATFIVEPPPAGSALPAGPQGIDVGVTPTGVAAAATFNAGSLRFSAPGGTVRIAEDSDTLLAGWGPGDGATASVAHTLQLMAFGDIRDEANAVVSITGAAADGSPVFDPTASASYYANGVIVLADAGSANGLSIDGLATFIGGGVDVGVASTGVATAATFNAGSLRFSSGPTARIAEDSSTVLVGWTTTPAPQTFPTQPTRNFASAVEITSAGSITDEIDFNLVVGGGRAVGPIGNATFVAKDEIVLADGATDANSLGINGVATFISTDGDAISVGATAAGVAAPAVFNAGSVRFVSVGGNVRIAEDTDTILADWAPASIAPSIPLPTPTASIAGNLELASTASITDEDNAAINVAGNATFVAGTDVTLADVGAANSLTVGGVATFVGGSGRLVRVGTTGPGVASPATFQAGSLRFYAPNGAVRVAEDDGTLLADWMTVPPSPLIATPPMATEARFIEIYSAGSITDAAGAVVIATGRNSAGVRVYDPTATATFVAAQSITLADGGADNKLIVDGLATFVSTTGAGQRIDVGVTPAGGMADAEYVAGSVRFSAPGGAVRLVEDASASFKGVAYAETPGTVIATFTASATAPIVPGTVVSNRAGSLELVSLGPITDVEMAFVEIAGDAGFRVLGSSFATDGDYSIRLADSGPGNALIIGGAATFVVDGARGIDVGVTPAGTPAGAEFTAGSLQFWSALGGSVRIAEDNATLLAGWSELPVGLIRPSAGVSFSQAATLDLLSTGAITDAAAAQLRVTNDATFIAGGAGAEPWAINLADGGADNQLSIGDLATFIVTAENKGIRVGVSASGTPADARFATGRLRFSAPTGAVEIAEDASTTIGGGINPGLQGTVLAGWTTDAVSSLLVPAPPTASAAWSLQLVSAGSITDSANAIVDITGDAGFLVTDVGRGEPAIVLADDNATATVNRLSVAGTATFVTLVGRTIDIGVTNSGAAAAGTFDAGALRFYGQNFVRIAEDSGTSLARSTTSGVLGVGGPLPASVAGTLQLTSNGVISDEASAAVEVIGDATFTVTSIVNVGDDRAIVLADRGGDSNRLVVGGLASFVVVQDPAGTPAKGIDVGVTVVGTPAGAVFRAGRLDFSARDAAVRVAEDDATLLAGGVSEAGSLQLLSAGTITDETATDLAVVGDATFVAAQSIQLADLATANKLNIGGLATFVVSANQTLAVGAPALGPASLSQFNAGGLRFYAPNGTARIAEDSATQFVDWMTAPPSPLIATPPMASEAKTIEIFSAGSITDTPTAVIIATGSSGGARVYDPTASATFVATNSITLADAGADNKLIVDGMLTLASNVGAAQRIDVGVTGAGAAAGAEFVAGSVRFSAPGGDVRLAEDASSSYKGVTYSETPGTHVAGWTPGTISGLIAAPPVRSAAASLEVTSAGAISDAADAKVQVAGNASFTVSTTASVTGPTAITLADGAAANELVVGARANFVVNQTSTADAKGIDVGVVPATGAPADALFTAGTLGFSADGGLVRLAEDNDTVLGGFSIAQDLELLSAGAITDTIDDDVAPTSVTLTQSAKLKAGIDGENDVTLGAGAAVFSMTDSDGNDPQLFNEAQYLAVQARNVSVHVDSAVNVRTGDAPLANLDNYSQFAGTFYLTAVGSVSQVTAATPTALTADKISVASDEGAVLLRLVELTGSGSDPNLQIKSGGSVALSQTLVGGGTVQDKFAGANIPSPDNSVYSPVIVEADDPLTGQRPDQPARPGNPGFEDVLAEDGENGRLSEAVRQASGNYPVDHNLLDKRSTTTIDNLYASVVIVRGDAVVGDVHDPSSDARRDFDTDEARGVEAADTGNVFLATTAGGDLLFTNRNREGEPGVLDAVAVQMAGGVFTAVAAGTLRIDTEDADSLAPGLRTTRLVSKTGTVTDVNSDSATQFGPRAILDASTEEGNAATTGLVRADQNFEQRITMALGSRGEDNLLVEVEWADVADIRTHSNANVRQAPDPNAPTNTVGSTSVLGSRLYADVVQTPVEVIESDTLNPRNDAYEYQLSPGVSRVSTITHNYDESFVPNNPAQNRLPTTIRVFNDSSINLFDNGGPNGAARDLNSASFSIAPRIITLPPPGYFIISVIELPQQFEPLPAPTPRLEPTQATQQTMDDSGRAVAVSSAEDVLYGRVDEKGEWIVDIPGESWPQVLEDAEGDFLREIRDRIDEGPYSNGRYIIKVVTPRSEQLLDEWVKGDDAEATGNAEIDAAAEPIEEAIQPADDLEPAAPAPLGPQPTPAEDAPLGRMERGLMEVGQFEPGGIEIESPPSDARNAALAAMAAVGVWRRRLKEAGPFTLDADGVAFTRVKRQRRRRGGD